MAKNELADSPEFISEEIPRICFSWLVMINSDAPVMYPTRTLLLTYCSRSAILIKAPATDMTPTMRTSRGMYSMGALLSVPAAAKKLNTMNAVPFVGPRIVKRELEKRGATMAATAEQIIP